jgi:hypothetical protein
VSLKQTIHLRSQSNVNGSDVSTYLRNSSGNVNSNGSNGSNGSSSGSGSGSGSGNSNNNNNNNNNNNSISNAKEQSYTSATSRGALENGVGYVPYSPYAFRRRDMILRPYSPSYRHELNRHQTSNGCKPEDCTNGRPYSPYCSRRFEERESSRERWQSTPRSLSPFARDYSPWRRENVDPPVIQMPSTSERYATMVQQRLGQIPRVPHAQEQNAYASPMVSRKRYEQVANNVRLLPRCLLPFVSELPKRSIAGGGITRLDYQ